MSPFKTDFVAHKGAVSETVERATARQNQVVFAICEGAGLSKHGHLAAQQFGSTILERNRRAAQRGAKWLESVAPATAKNRGVPSPVESVVPSEIRCWKVPHQKEPGKPELFKNQFCQPGESGWKDLAKCCKTFEKSSAFWLSRRAQGWVPIGRVFNRQEPAPASLPSANLLQPIAPNYHRWGLAWPKGPAVSRITAIFATAIFVTAIFATTILAAMNRKYFLLALWGCLLFSLAARASQAAWIESPLITQGYAESHGLTRAWHAQLSIDSERSKIQHLKLEAGLILAVTSDGWLHVLDAETGLVNWRALVGDPRFVTLSAGANEKFIAVVNGDTLLIYDRASGRVAFKYQIRGTAELGPALTKTRVLVPTVKGPLESYPLDANPEVAILGPQQLPPAGRMVNEPATFNRSVVWAGDRDRLFGQEFAEKSTKFSTYIRFGVNSGPVSFPPMVYVGTKAGFLVAFNQDRGKRMWEFPAGSPIFHPPVALNDVVYALPQDGGMFAVKADTGQQLWYADEPLKFVAASPTLAYTLDYRNRLTMIDVKTGARADVMPLPEGLKRIINQRTDRLYLYTAGGLIQCLHEPQLVEPHRYEPAPAAKPGEVDPFAVPGAAAPMPGDATAEPMAEAGAMP